MERKVIKQGNDTLTITLPREWTKKYNIKAGDSLGIKAKNEILEIRNKEINLKEPIYFDVNFNDEKLLNWTLGALYKIGFEEIHLRYSDTTIFNKIQKLIKNNLGFIITDQEKNMCIIKNMTTDNSDNLSA
ncbi:MAG: AbrB/MazE/SpoVT family DNA-binding domain-containing protein, partial [Candidatus Pacearchaeota archaeon]